jgi:adenylate cyclase
MVDLPVFLPGGGGPVTTERVRRKLVAILAADVKDYSRLMGEDEMATVRTLKEYRRIMTSLIRKYRGRVVDSPGDNVLAEFSSVVDAVDCAVEVQRALQAKNAELSQDRKMEFRIGINLGDVIKDGKRIYGDGVNIASRVEGLAVAGGICISGSAHDHLEGKAALGFEYLGEQRVKNIKKPVRIYRVKMAPGLSLPGMDKPLALPEKPSIAVLPFVNMSDDPKQEYFSDGITEDLITDLSKISGLFVIARNSVFVYKGKPVKIGDVGQELGVRYVLEGSVRKAGSRVRITAQLVDAIKGYHLWAERYDRELRDIFSLQDEVAQKIVKALAVTLTEDEQKRLVHKETDNLEAFDHYLRGSEYKKRFTKEANVQARQMFERAIKLDSRFALAYAELALTHVDDWCMGWSEDPQSLDLALEFAQKALAFDELLPLAHRTLGHVYCWKKQHGEAIDAEERAVTLDPNDAEGYAELGRVLSWAGRDQEAEVQLKKAMRLNPHFPVWYLYVLGQVYAFTGRYEEAIDVLKRALIRNPDFLPTHIVLAFIYGETGHRNKARGEVEEILRISPNYSLQVVRETVPLKDQAVLEKVLEALRKARLK